MPIKKKKPEMDLVLQSSARTKRIEILDKAYLVYREENLPMYLKPIRTVIPTKCAISGKFIQAGEYAYPCYENPVRLSVSGNCKVLIHEALKNIESLLPKGFFSFRLPTTTDLVNVKALKEAQVEQRKALYKEGTRLLKEGKIAS